MKDYYLLAGTEVLLRLPDKRKLILNIGMPLSDSEGKIKIDEEYNFIVTRYKSDEVVSIFAKKNLFLPQKDKLILLLQKEMNIDRAKEWLGARKAINVNTLYIVDGKGIVLVNEEDRIEAASVSDRCIKRIYYLEDMDEWENQWKECVDVLNKKKGKERENKKIRQETQQKKKDIESIKKELSEYINCLEKLMWPLKGLKLIEKILTDELLKTVERQRENFANIAQKQDNEDKELILKEYGRIKVGKIKNNIENVFKTRPEENEGMNEVEEDIELLGKVENAKEMLENIKNAEKQSQEGSLLFHEKVVFSTTPIGIKEEISNIRSLIEKYEKEHEKLKEEREKWEGMYNKVNLPFSEIVNLYSNKEEEKKSQFKKISTKIDQFLKSSEGYEPCETVVKKIQKQFSSIKSDKYKRENSFLEIYKRLKFLREILKNAEQWLEEEERFEM